MPRFQKYLLNGHTYLTDAKVKPIKGDLAYCTDAFDNSFIVRVLGNDGMYISYKLDDDKVRHCLSGLKIVTSSDSRLGLPATQEEMLPYVPLVELTIKLWAAKEKREFDVTCEYDALDDTIVLHTNNCILTSCEISISKINRNFLLKNIKVENGRKQTQSSGEYDRLLMLLLAIFKL